MAAPPEKELSHATADAHRYFLGVERSLRAQAWRTRLDQNGENRAQAMAEQHDMPEIIARVLAGRGVAVEDGGSFLRPSIRDLMPDPASLTDAMAAAQRLAKAISTGERVAIFGDYDVDGACSAALMARFLAHFGIEHEIYIPDRIFEGYGPNTDAIGELCARGARLIVTVDCGSTSLKALDEAARHGVDVVVLDHHQVGTALPQALAVVNPNREDDLSGQGHLCAAGVVFLVLVATLKALRESGDERAHGLDLLSLLDLVALATVCDVVPLKGLNRAYVVKGLIAARHMGNAGLAALVRKVALSGPIAPYHFGFIIGPRLNAGGRIGDAALGSRLLTLSDPAEADEIADRLDGLNRERQAMEKAMLVEAEAEAMAEFGAPETGEESDSAPAVIVTAGTGWHAGIVGLIAARLKERYHRPAFAIAFDENGTGTGSGRSIPGLDLGRMVRKAVAQGLVEKGGGHAMAAGLTLERSRLARLRAFFEEEAGATVTRLSGLRALKIDGALAASAATLELVDLVERAGPYGAGHDQPVFALPAHRLADIRVVGSDHLKLTLVGPDGAKLDAMAFRAADRPYGRALLAGRGANFHFAGHLSGDFWRGSRRVQFRIVDAATLE